MNKDPRYLLISCCNTLLNLSRFSLLLYDILEDKFSFVDLDGIINPNTSAGLTGIAITDERIYVSTQSRQDTQILTFDAELNHIENIAVPSCLGAHSMIHHDQNLYICSTASNEILKIDEKHKVSSYWEYKKPWGKGPKHLHMNSIAFHNDEFYVLMHSGINKSQDSSGGVLYNLDRKKVLVDHLNQPHSLTRIDNGFVLLDSNRGQEVVINDNGEINRKDIVPGYARGLTLTKDRKYIGISSKRISSRKQGIGKKYFFGNASEYMGHEDFMSYLCIVDNDNQLIRKINTTAYTFEIYDVIGLPSNSINKERVIYNPEIIKAQECRWRIHELLERLQKK